MSEMKRCVQCGMLKDVSEFRLYTYSRQKGTKGTYRICKSCENINTKYKHAKQIIAEYPNGLLALPADLPYAQAHAIATRYNAANNIVKRTEALFALLEEKGLHIINIPEDRPTDVDDIEKLMAFYEQPTVVPAIIPATDLPDDLKYWLTSNQDEWLDKGLAPEYLQETIYNALKAKYRPQLSFDQVKGLPIYDDTYKTALNEILRRFDDYEDSCQEVDDESSNI